MYNLFSTLLSSKFGKNSLIKSFPLSFEKLAKYCKAWISTPSLAWSFLSSIITEFPFKSNASISAFLRSCVLACCLTKRSGSPKILESSISFLERISPSSVSLAIIVFSKIFSEKFSIPDLILFKRLFFFHHLQGYITLFIYDFRLIVFFAPNS